MKKFMMLALSLCCVSSTVVQTANAEGYANSNGSYKVQKNLLQKADWNTTPLEYQILDRRPTVRDFRTPDVEPNTLVLDLGALPSVPGKTINMGNGSGGASGAPFKSAPAHLRSLPQSGFFSDPNANLSRANVGPLPDGKTIGSHAPVTAQEVRGQLQQRLANKQTSPGAQGAQAASYGLDYKNPGTATAGSTTRTNASATGRLLPRLNQSPKTNP